MTFVHTTVKLDTRVRRKGNASVSTHLTLRRRIGSCSRIEEPFARCVGARLDPIAFLQVNVLMQDLTPMSKG